MIVHRSTAKTSYYKGPKHESLKRMTVGHLIDEAAEKYPNREAIVSVHQNRKITFSDLKHEVVETKGSYFCFFRRQDTISIIINYCCIIIR